MPLNKEIKLNQELSAANWDDLPNMLRLSDTCNPVNCNFFYTQKITEKKFDLGERGPPPPKMVGYYRHVLSILLVFFLIHGI